MHPRITTDQDPIDPVPSTSLSDGWRFTEGSPPDAEAPDFDDGGWETVRLPHDWSIAHPFCPDAPAYCRGAWLPAGQGGYRRRLCVPDAWQGKHISLHFDGAYRNAQVFCNGHRVGGRPWGYIAFECNLTPCLHPGGDNLIAVKLDNRAQPGSRWYTGCGLYRDVTLRVRDSIHIPTWGTAITTDDLSAALATIRVKTQWLNTTEQRAGVETRTLILDPDGEEVCRQEKTHVIGAGLRVGIEEAFVVDQPQCWDPDQPRLYTLRQSLMREGCEIDRVDTRFGIRTLRFDADTGFWINGRNLKLKGVCLHADGGALGAACGPDTFARQLRTLKTMGCNAVRTAHHPFSSAFLDACDALGMLVLAEAFDEWQVPITTAPFSDGEPQTLNVRYYADLFDRWAIRDLRDMVLRDRNHPSIFMWSIGNEVPQMHRPSGRAIAERLTETVQSLDDRPVTCAVVAGGVWRPVTDANIEALDVAGYNYPSIAFLDDQKLRHPRRPMIVTEHYSAQPRLARDERPPGGLPELPYRHPGALRAIRTHAEMKPGMEAWEAVAVRPFVMGLFIWTGWDYLGEITPYDWPAHYAFYGVIDGCGFPKDGYFYYRSRWRREPLVHICTHWNWTAGEQVRVRVISNCETVALWINDHCLGARHAVDGLVWDAPFVPGVLKAVGTTNAGVPCEHVVRTAGAPARLRLNREPVPPTHPDPDRATVYIACDVVDAQDFPAPLADTEIRFETRGGVKLLALDNGNPFDTTPFQGGNTRRAFHGKCLAIVENARSATGTLTARADGLQSDTLELNSATSRGRMKS